MNADSANAAGPWRPELTLGAQSAGGLMLPDAHPTAATMYAPRAVWIDDRRLIAADTGNHRVLIWNQLPRQHDQPADVVLGQADEKSEGPQRGGRDPATGMNLPTGLLLTPDGRLIVADAWNHRLLVWHELPTKTGGPPDEILGQSNATAIDPNRGQDVSANGFYWPFGIALIDGRFYVADTGNRRVLVWEDGIPHPDQPADDVLGQDDFSGHEENRGQAAGPASFRWPHSICGNDGGGIFIADAGNHRVLRWDRHPDHDQPADGVIGQPDFTANAEFPYQSQNGKLRFPYGACAPGLTLADTANNRVLIWDAAPLGVRREAADETGMRALRNPEADAPTNHPTGEPPDHLLAQPNFDVAGENRWSSVADDTLCWPYGIARHGDTMAIADSGNNRVTIWQREAGD